MLVDYCDNRYTDKNSAHSYVPFYDELFASKEKTATSILEVGIQTGGSMTMWANYFTNAVIHGLDIMHIDHVRDELKNDSRLRLYTSVDAYDPAYVEATFASKGMQFDMMLDDGPHTLESMVAFIKLYSPMLKSDGIMVVEDVADIAWIETLKEATPDELKPFIEVHDRRPVKGQWDDILFVINKSRT
jgi:cephalosporin hydroxylase